MSVRTSLLPLPLLYESKQGARSEKDGEKEHQELERPDQCPERWEVIPVCKAVQFARPVGMRTVHR